MGVFSSISRLFRKEILYILYSGFVTIYTDTPPFLLRLIVHSVCTLTVGSLCSKINFLGTSKLTNCEAWYFRVMPERYIWFSRLD